jgi:hypothetical protein
MAFPLCFFLLVVVVAASSRLQTGESSEHMINAAWLEYSDKFELIARWGVK